jgi:hypothetical protein
MEKKFDFKVEDGLLIKFKNLYAKVIVTPGQDENVSILIKGEEKLIGNVEINQKDSKNISLKSKAENTTIISSNNRFTGNSTFINVSNSVVVSGGSVYIGSGNVIIGDEKKVLIEIEISAPKGTDIDTSGVKEFHALGVEGRLWASVSGQSFLEVQRVKNPRVDCSGQSEAKLFDASGCAKINVSGQSSSYLAGALSDIDVDASGQSKVALFADCVDVDLNASGMSNIEFHGKCTGHIRRNTSGMSRIGGV